MMNDTKTRFQRISQARNLLLVWLFGYILGLLFAPKKGSALREEIKDFLLNLQDMSSSVLGEAKSKGQAFIDKAQPAFDQVKEEAKNLKSKAATSFNEAVARASAKQ